MPVDWLQVLGKLDAYSIANNVGHISFNHTIISSTCRNEQTSEVVVVEAIAGVVEMIAEAVVEVMPELRGRRKTSLTCQSTWTRTSASNSTAAEKVWHLESKCEDLN